MIFHLAGDVFSQACRPQAVEGVSTPVLGTRGAKQEKRALLEHKMDVSGAVRWAAGLAGARSTDSSGVRQGQHQMC